MQTTVITIPSHRITDWESFHTVFVEVFGFPAFYGRNMDAWLDCMTNIDAPSTGLTTISINQGALLALRIDGASDFERRCPEQFRALLECAAFVNSRRAPKGLEPVLALMLCGD